MIEGANNRVPPSDHWDIFRQGDDDHHDLIAALSMEIRTYTDSLGEVNSTEALLTILSRWTHKGKWARTFGKNSSKLFGMVMWVVFFDDRTVWRTEQRTIGERQVRVYCRVNTR